VNTKNSWSGYAIGALVAGVLLAAAMGFLVAVSPRFEYGSPFIDRPHRTLVAVLMGAGAVFLFAVYALEKITPARRGLALILGAGLIMRATLFFSQPIHEDDFYRYLWDGGVVAHGHNPYPLIPNDVRDPGKTPIEIAALANDAGLVFERVNHRELATVYPPIAQAGFTAAHMLKPWSLTAWRGVVLIFDLAALGILLLVLHEIGAPLQRIAIYWWNPVLLMEAYNSGHMDVLVVPFILAAVWFALRHRPLRSGVALALAAGVKLWPVILAPILLRAIRAPWPRLAIGVGAGTFVLGLLTLPMLAGRHIGDRSGFVAYGESWEMNDALFMILLSGAKFVADTLDLGGQSADLIARGAAAAIVLAVVALLSRKPAASGLDLANRLGIAVGVLFMLSPTQFPWYYIWILPFLALYPRASLLSLTVMLPIYYLRFRFSALDNVEFFHNRLVWVEYAPVLILAAWEWWRETVRRAPRGETVHA